MRRLAAAILLLSACKSPQQAREPAPSANGRSAPNANAGFPPSASAESVPLTRSAGADPAAECKATCNGEFGQHGLNPTPQCLCRTHDVGKQCESSGECEGQCIGDASLTRVVEPGPPKRGYYVGRCSEFRTTFGCSPLLPKAKPAAPQALDAPLPTVCID